MPVASHTPGPWGMETVRTSCGVCHKIGPWPHKWRAGTTMSACIYDDYPSPPEGTDTMLANARLIAAAPDLLAALRKARQLVDIATDWNLDEVEIDGEMVPTHSLGQAFDAAIAKADPASLPKEEA